MPFSTRMLLQQLVVIVLMMTLATVVYGWLTFQRLSSEVGAKSLAVAQSLSEDQGIRAALSGRQPALPDPRVLAVGPVQRVAEVVRVRTDALFVVVTDGQGVRWSHPNPALLGKKVSTSPEAALSGQEITVQEVGTLGASVRSKVPVRSLADNSIVGEVSVGYAMQDVLDGLWTSAGPILGVGVITLVLGALGSSLLSRRLRVHTLGLEPEEIGALVQDQEVVLYGIAEGVIGLSASGLVTVCNAKATRLLHLDDPVGKTPAELGLPRPVLALLEADAGDAAESVQVVIEQSVLIVSARKVVRAKRDLGWVIMVHDRTDVVALTQQLGAVGALTTALRAQRHEFANRLHTVSGLLDLGHAEQAADYLHLTLENGPLKYPLENGGLLSDTYLLAFLGAKSAEAAEKGVQLRIGEGTVLHHRVEDAQNVTTVLGNLVDNAVMAAVAGSGPDRWVEVELLSDRAALHLLVSDSGNGLQTADLEQVFTQGYSTAASGQGTGHGEGLGLALSRQLARLGGGDVWLVSAGSDDGPGAVFAARLENALDFNAQVRGEGTHG
ncbi:sensor histidine kinase [Paenarthrobacter sp. PH39-S1]|uniref:sensor histidine kinase n=1 Tax=Paenarthrobacter sp. PH39-S1 TaxID=3046204 RepID=UPI0024B9CA41|nr:sensor histidine kinase [Paenarthrobacter sp. PH39-S1]MDJ0357662.1 sensor histidine kinase [Paenarthrobacter sp. PH39-S1]